MPAPQLVASDDIVVETDLYKAVFSTQGGVVKYWELKEYKDNNEMPVVLLKQPGQVPPLSVFWRKRF